MVELNGGAQSRDETVHRWRLVVADDMIINADSLSDVLRLMGHDVLTAYDGYNAIAAHDTFRPDAYILDLGMPGLDGYQTCRAIRALQGGESVAIIALSGWGRSEDLTHSLQVGFSSFLLKPAHPAEVLSCLNRFLALRTRDSRRWTDG